MKSNRLVIGLDYGTTYTGVSFCETSDTGVLGKAIEVIKDWPMRQTKIGTKEKIPSEIAVLDRTQWGALIAPNVQRHIWTKLLLEDSQNGEVDKILKELSLNDRRAPSTKPLDIIAEYLAHVKAHLLKNLDNQYGPELWRTLPITLVVTVPAVWSDSAKDTTLKAINKAGFNKSELPELKRTVLATEPEAAAIYTIQSLRGSVQDSQFAIGDGFVVCDMGGGTVDLISYRVAENEPTVLEEATVGSGDKCGGSFVERGFLKWLERRLGTADFVMIAGEKSEDLPRTSMSPKLSRMVQDFVSEAKSGFTGVETNYLRLPPPLSGIEEDEARGILDGEIKITPDDMKEMFGFSLCRTYELLLEQIQQARSNGALELKYVFMVGGFAESPYMYEKIKAFVEGNNVQVIRPAFAWSAVVRGAAAKGLEGDGRAPIKKRKCRRHYGTGCAQIFNPDKHRESDAFICTFTRQKRAGDQMSWLVNKGQDLSTDDLSHAEKHFIHHFWDGDSRIATICLHASDEDDAPQRKTKPSVYKLATLDVDLSDVPESEFQLLQSPHGSAYYRLVYTVEISVQSVLEFTLSVNGTKYGSVTARYT